MAHWLMINGMPNSANVLHNTSDYWWYKMKSDATSSVYLKLKEKHV